MAASLRAADAEQVQMMSEEIIVVDEADTALRAGSKKETHEWKAIKGDKLLHRAFSVFLLSPDGRLLVQQVRLSRACLPGAPQNAPFGCGTPMPHRGLTPR